MTHDQQSYAPAMDESRYDREVEEQLAEALPVLGQAVLKRALADLHRLLESCPNAAHQKFLIWLWTEARGRFDAVSLGQQGPGLRIWLPEDDGDLAVAVEETEIRVDIDPVTSVRGRYAVTTAMIKGSPRTAAATVLNQLERNHAKEHRRREYESRRGQQ